MKTPPTAPEVGQHPLPQCRLAWFPGPAPIPLPVYLPKAWPLQGAPPGLLEATHQPALDFPSCPPDPPGSPSPA